MPKLLQNPKVTQALVKAFDLKGRYSPSLDEIVVPVYVLQDPAPAEPNRLAVGFGKLQGVAGPSVQLFNPVNSGNMLMVNQVLMDAFKPSVPDLNFTIELQFSGSPLPDNPGVRAIEFRDRRLGNDKPVAQIFSQNTTFPTGQFFIQRNGFLPQGPGLEEIDVLASPFIGVRQPPIVLPPGQGVSLTAVTVVDTIAEFIVNFLWEEIPLIGSAQLSAGTPP